MRHWCLTANNAYVKDADLHLQFAGTDDEGLTEFQRLSLDVPQDPASVELLRRMHAIFPDLTIREIVGKIHTL